MAKTKIDIGAVVDFLTKGELDDSLQHHIAEYAAKREIAEQVHYEGIKYIRLPFLVGTAASGTLALGTNASSPQITPDQGYCWNITRLFINGLNGADQAIIYRNDPSMPQNALWQLTASVPCATFTKMGLVLNPGDVLTMKGIGSLTSTVQISMTGEAISVPAEMLAKLV